VRAGFYLGGCCTAKALTILGSPGASLGFGLGVAGLPRNKQFVLKGLLTNLLLINNQGRILLDQVRDVSGWSIASCSDVQIKDCSVFLDVSYQPPPAVNISMSIVTMTGCVLDGAPSWGGRFYYYPTSPALTATSSVLVLSWCRLTGGLGAPSGYPDSPGLVVTNCTTTINGAQRLSAGQGGTTPVSAIVAQGGSLTIDPTVPLLPVGNALPISGNASITRTWLPSVTASGAPPAGTAQATVRSPTGDAVLLFAGLCAYPQSLGALGDLWLDPLRFFFVGAGIQGSGLPFSVSLRLPNDPMLAFQAWTFQGLSGTAAGGFKVTNGVGVALD
jgi:hypothetical protein